MFPESSWADEVTILKDHSVAMFVVSPVQYHLLQKTAVRCLVGDALAAGLGLG